MPIISRKVCQDTYHNIEDITIDYICTYYAHRLKRCGYGDSGAPLTANGQLVGIMSWSGVDDNSLYPHVFANLLHPDYRNWIRSYVPNAL